MRANDKSEIKLKLLPKLGCARSRMINQSHLSARCLSCGMMMIGRREGTETTVIRLLISYGKYLSGSPRAGAAVRLLPSTAEKRRTER